MTALPFRWRSLGARDLAALASISGRGWHPRLQPPATRLFLLGWACAQVRGSEPRPEEERARPPRPQRPSLHAALVAPARRAVPTSASVGLSDRTVIGVQGATKVVLAPGHVDAAPASA